MIPLLGFSVVSLAVVIDRLLWGPNPRRVMPAALQDDAARLIQAGRLDELIGRCRGDKSPLARILLAALTHLDRPRQEIVESMEIVGKREAMSMQRRLGALGSIAAASPLMGLLGTVFGMIATFAAISQHGTGNPALLAGGISEALVSTATGLTVAIPSLLFHRFFLNRSRQLVVEMETTTLDLLEQILERRRVSTSAPSELLGKDSALSDDPRSRTLSR